MNFIILRGINDRIQLLVKAETESIGYGNYELDKSEPYELIYATKEGLNIWDDMQLGINIEQSEILEDVENKELIKEIFYET
jgi:hypothetical protein